MIPPLLRTTTFRLAVGYLALFGASSLLLLAFIYWQTAGYMARQLDETIRAEIVGLAEQYRLRGLEGLAAIIRDRAARDPGSSAVYLLADSQLRSIVGNLDRWPTAEESTDGWIEFELRDRSNARGDLYFARARHFILGGGYHLLVGRDARAFADTRQVVMRALFWGFALMLALGIGGALLMARGALRRIDRINRTTAEIMAGDLSRRIPVTGSHDDLDDLAGNLNAMLDRIQALMDGMRHVSEGIAHDLRSPLTRLRHRLETLRLPAGPEERHRLIDAAIMETDSLLATFNALLRIAEAESGRARAAFASVALVALAQEAIELYEPVAQEKRQTITLHADAGELTIHGDRHLLAQSLANLLDNTIKYTPDQGRIDVAVRNTAGGVALTVSDNGAGIPASLRDKVLERFYRADESRTTPGSGLGLSLVAAVARLHDARLLLDDNHPGLSITILFRHPPRA